MTTTIKELNRKPDLPSEPLNARERATLNNCETIIRQGLQTYEEVIDALETVREERLYREEFKTFEEYCRSRWHMTSRHVNRLIAARQIAENLGPLVPNNEAQARALSCLPMDEQRAVWEALTRQADPSQITALQVETAVALHLARQQGDTTHWGEGAEFAVTTTDGEAVRVVYEPGWGGTSDRFQFFGPIAETASFTQYVWGQPSDLNPRAKEALLPGYKRALYPTPRLFARAFAVALRADELERQKRLRKPVETPPEEGERPEPGGLDAEPLSPPLNDFFGTLPGEDTAESELDPPSPEPPAESEPPMRVVERDERWDAALRMPLMANGFQEEMARIAPTPEAWGRWVFELARQNQTLRAEIELKARYIAVLHEKEEAQDAALAAAQDRLQELEAQLEEQATPGRKERQAIREEAKREGILQANERIHTALVGALAEPFPAEQWQRWLPDPAEAQATDVAALWGEVIGQLARRVKALEQAALPKWAQTPPFPIGLPLRDRKDGTIFRITGPALDSSGGCWYLVDRRGRRIAQQPAIIRRDYAPVDQTTEPVVTSTPPADTLPLATQKALREVGERVVAAAAPEAISPLCQSCGVQPAQADAPYCLDCDPDQGRETGPDLFAARQQAQETETDGGDLVLTVESPCPACGCMPADCLCREVARRQAGTIGPEPPADPTAPDPCPLCGAPDWGTCDCDPDDVNAALRKEGRIP